MYADYECKKCGDIELYQKPYGEEFPQTIPCEKCKEGQQMNRVYSLGAFQVCEGFAGNAKNGYTSTDITYHPAGLTPSNKVYGKYGRVAGVETEHSN